MSQEHSQRLEPLASEVIDQLQTVADAAQSRLANARPLDTEALANAGTVKVFGASLAP
jgi:hypothetical protein